MTPGLRFSSTDGGRVVFDSGCFRETMQLRGWMRRDVLEQRRHKELLLETVHLFQRSRVGTRQVDLSRRSQIKKTGYKFHWSKYRSWTTPGRTLTILEGKKRRRELLYFVSTTRTPLFTLRFDFFDKSGEEVEGML